MGVEVMKSEIKHPMAGTWRLARVQLGKSTVAGYYSRTLFYQDVYKRLHEGRMFEKNTVGECNGL